jgi:hypothetical protein
MKRQLTKAELVQLITYDPETGIFHWKVNKGVRAKAGMVAGSINSDGYLQIQIDRVLYKCHRLAWLYVHGDWPKNCIDHINRVRTDNRITNLREATKNENMQNISAKNPEGIKGVDWHKNTGKWRSRISVDGKSKLLGYFDSKELADTAYREAAAVFHSHNQNASTQEVAV